MNKLHNNEFLNNSITNTVFITSECTEEQKDKVCSNLYNHNVMGTNGLLKKPGFGINLYLKDDELVIGAILCDTFNYCMYIDVLWIDEKYRGYGYGKQLIDQAEKIAKESGCVFSHTCTFSYQSPEFYKSCGYKVFAELSDYPNNITQYFFKKTFKEHENK